ncbi:MAG: hypothetical protein ACTHNG_13545 [Ginsengibacter sp.]
MKSILFITTLLVAQTAFCQSTKNKSELKVSQKTSSTQTTTPHRNLNLPVVYTFIGDGAWSTVSNWDSNGVPPADITPGSEIHINTQVSGGKCILDVPYEVPNTTNTIKLIVYSGNKLVVPDLDVR